MQASAIPATVGSPPAAETRSPLRLRTDEQLVALFRAGSEDAFAAIHDRYRQSLLSYARRMLPGAGQDAEDVAQEVFASAYRALRTDDRHLTLRAWLYRVAHNRCIDLLRRPPATPSDLGELDAASMITPAAGDPPAQAELHETLTTLIADLQSLPEKQRTALLARELCGMSYTELASLLETSVPAVKSLLVRARHALIQAQESRLTACATVRADLARAHAAGARASATARRHLRDCASCRRAHTQLAPPARGARQRLGALMPFCFGGLISRWLGLGSGSSGVAAGSGAVGCAGAGVGSAGVSYAGAGVAYGGATVGGLLASGAGHAVALLAAAAIAVGGAVGESLVGLGPGSVRSQAHGLRQHYRAPGVGRQADSLAAAATARAAVAGARVQAANPPSAARPPAACGHRPGSCMGPSRGAPRVGRDAANSALGSLYNTSMSMDAGGQSAFDGPAGADRWRAGSPARGTGTYALTGDPSGASGDQSTGSRATTGTVVSAAAGQGACQAGTQPAAGAGAGSAGAAGDEASAGVSLSGTAGDSAGGVSTASTGSAADGGPTAAVGAGEDGPSAAGTASVSGGTGPSASPPSAGSVTTDGSTPAAGMSCAGSGDQTSSPALDAADAQASTAPASSVAGESSDAGLTAVGSARPDMGELA